MFRVLFEIILPGIGLALSHVQLIVPGFHKSANYLGVFSGCGKGEDNTPQVWEKTAEKES